jgi:phage baseplate assembly protein W
MNYNIINKNINELSNKGIGLNIPYNGNIGLNITYNTKDAIRSNLLNFLLTGKRERPMNPNFGINLKNKLFEQINNTELSLIKTDIITYIKDNFNNINILALEINSNDNIIEITFNYSVINTNINDDIQLIFKK